MESFTPGSAFAGGALIGLAASLMWLLNGCIAGVSGIVGGLVETAPRDERRWRLLFLAGMLAGGLVLVSFDRGLVRIEVPRSLPAMAIAGLLVGFGTRLGNGCTSGHGVCGLSRLSPRSIAATALFMLAGFATVFLVHHVLGGSL